jgi:hypothetical protein
MAHATLDDVVNGLATLANTMNTQATITQAAQHPGALTDAQFSAVDFAQVIIALGSEFQQSRLCDSRDHHQIRMCLAMAPSFAHLISDEARYYLKYEAIMLLYMVRSGWKAASHMMKAVLPRALPAGQLLPLPPVHMTANSNWKPIHKHKSKQPPKPRHDQVRPFTPQPTSTSGAPPGRGRARRQQQQKSQ